MKCERVLARLETGRAWQRLTARMHVRRCRGCQVARQKLASLKLELSCGEPLNETHRKNWLAAATPMPVNRAPHQVRPALRWAPVALACVLIAMAALAVRFAIHRAAQELPQLRPVSPTAEVVPVTGEQAWLQLADIRSRLGVLSRELDELAAQVAFMDEEREVQELLAHYSLDENSMIQERSRR